MSVQSGRDLFAARHPRRTEPQPDPAALKAAKRLTLTKFASGKRTKPPESTEGEQPDPPDAA